MTVERKLHGLPPVPGRAPEPPEIAWRRSQLVAAGFEAEDADELAAAADVDLHALLNLVDRGCPPPLAARIMGTLVDANG